MIRLCVDIVLFAAALCGYSFLFVPLACVALFFFERHYESVIAALAIDILYGAPLWAGVDVTYVFGCAAALLFLVAEILKKRLRYHSPF